MKLHEGASKLGWHSLEVPRWFSYENAADSNGTRQSMTKTFIPAFLRSGGKVLPETKVERIRQENSRWVLKARHRMAGVMCIEADSLFVAAGAIQTPALLRRCGIKRNIGNSLQFHPTVKVVGRFPEQVNSTDMGVPVHQVKEFAPRLSLGCSISTPPYLALGLLNRPQELKNLRTLWSQMANYYA